MTFKTESEKRRDAMREGMEAMRAKLSELDLINSEVSELEKAAVVAYDFYRGLRQPYDDAYTAYLRASDTARQKSGELIELRSSIQRIQMDLLTLSIEELGLGE